MKEKDNGISELQLKISENNVPPKEIDGKLPINDKSSEKIEGIANKKNEDQNQTIKDQNQKNIEHKKDVDLIEEKNQINDNKINKNNNIYFKNIKYL